MIIRQWALAWLAGAAAMAATGPASAETTRVELRLSGPTWHAAACPHGNPYGTARCHARIVTDARGNAHRTASRANGHAECVPSGYGPADLQAAYADHRRRELQDDRDRRRLWLPERRSRPRGLPRAIRSAGLHDRERLLQEGQPERRAGQLSARQTPAGRRSRRSTSTWRAPICPNCKIVLVQATTRVLRQPGDGGRTPPRRCRRRAISNSYGGERVRVTPATKPSTTSRASRSPSALATSGYGAQFPASSPHVIAVGGTSLTAQRQPRLERDGVERRRQRMRHSAMPSRAGRTDTELCAARMEADVSAVADPNTGVAVYGPTSSRRLRLDGLRRNQRRRRRSSAACSRSQRRHQSAQPRSTPTRRRCTT